MFSLHILIPFLAKKFTLIAIQPEMEQIDRNTSLLHERTMIYLIHVFKGKKYHGNSLEKNVKSTYPSKYKEYVNRFIQHLLVLHFGLQ